MLHTALELGLLFLRPRAASLAALALLLSVGGHVAAQANCDARSSLAVGHAHGVPGQTVEVGLIGRSPCEVNGFALAVGHDANRLQFVRVEPGEFLDNYADNDLFVLSDFDNTLGFMTLLVAFDLTAPLTVEPRGIPAHTPLMKLSYRIKPGALHGTTQLRNEDRKYGFPPISHVFTTEDREINPVLMSGSITIQAFNVDAGEDQMLPEGSFLTLSGSASGFGFGRVPSYRWTQKSGPLTQQVAGASSAVLTVQLPQVNGDEVVVFELKVDDGSDVAKDTVEIVVTDSDARGGEVRKVATPSRLDFGPATEAVALAGSLEWGTDFEDGIWTAIRFRANSHAVLDEIARARLYIDEDESGGLSAGDRQLGSLSSPFAGGQTSLSFILNERLRMGEPAQFLLVVERGAPAPARGAAFPVWPGLAVLAAAMALRGVRRGPGAAAAGSPCLGWVGVALALALLAPACSSGGGGGSGSPAGVVFSIDDESDVDIHGEITGTPGIVNGLPIKGSELSVN